MFRELRGGPTYDVDAGAAPAPAPVIPAPGPTAYWHDDFLAARAARDVADIAPDPAPMPVPAAESPTDSDFMRRIAHGDYGDDMVVE